MTVVVPSVSTACVAAPSIGPCHQYLTLHTDTPSLVDDPMDTSDDDVSDPNDIYSDRHPWDNRQLTRQGAVGAQCFMSYQSTE